MVMRKGKDGQAQRMVKRVTGEGALMLRLFEILILCWLLLYVGNASSRSSGITLVPAAAWCPHAILDTLRRQSIFGSNVCATCTMGWTSFHGLARWRRLHAT